MVKRVQVRWSTTEVIYYEHVFEVPDDWDRDAIDADPNFWDGNCPELIAHEDAEFDEHGLRFDEFTREAETVEVLAPTTGGAP